MQCPFCPKEPTTERGLRAHLVGRLSGRGHARTNAQARALVLQARTARRVARAAAPVVIPAPPLAALAFLTETFDLLVANKRLPKYQFERRVDIFFGVFLTDVLAALLGGKFQLVVPEFPLKRDIGCMSANVDYLLFWTTTAAEEKWIFLEFKTAATSFDLSQLERYRRGVEQGMPALLDGLARIRERTGSDAEYEEVLQRVDPYPKDRPIEIIYFTAAPEPKLAAYPDVRAVTFDKLLNLEIDKHPEVWRMFRDSVIARAFASYFLPDEADRSGVAQS